MKQTPNEKLIETLFIHHALRHLERSGGFVYTPSSREEYEKGYDAKLMGASAFDELYLQFKRPYLVKWNGYSFATYKHQHDRLQAYPADTAYYLTTLFRSLEQIQEARRQTTGSLNFLEWYVAIEIGRLGDVKLFRYYGSTRYRVADEIRYKLRTDLELHPKRQLDKCGWMTGAELLQRFGRNEVGTRIILQGREGRRDTATRSLAAAGDSDRIRRMSPEIAGEMARGNYGRDWGFALRKNAELLVQNNE